MKLAHEGSSFDAMAAMPKGGGEYGKLRMGGAMSKDLQLLLMAAPLRCMINRCPHVFRDPSVVRYVFLAPRIVTCQPCILSFRAAMEEYDRAVPRSDECDLCLKRAVPQFWKFQIAWNGCLYVGDACESCITLYSDCVQRGASK